MNDKELVVALAQLELGKSRALNLERGLAAISQAAREGANIVVFPELFLGYPFQGYPPGKDAEPAGGRTLLKVAKEAGDNDISVLMGFPERGEDGKLFNSAFFADRQGNIRSYYRKSHLWITEDPRITPGDDLPVFSIEKIKVGSLICFDIEFPEPARLLALRGAELILVPSANTVEYSHCHRVNLMSRALENKVFTALCNWVGEAGPYRLGGLSAISDPFGRIICEAGETEEKLVLCRLDLSLVQQAREVFDYLRIRRPEVYGALVRIDAPKKGGTDGKA